jgi:hypothetical protein
MCGSEVIAHSGTRPNDIRIEPSSKKTRTPRLHSNKPNTDPSRLAKRYRLSVESGDLLWLDGHWRVTHSGLVRLARRNHCAGIHVEPVAQFSDPATSRWAFKATVYKSRTCRGFTDYGDACPSNVSALVRGAEMRVAATRAIDRAIRVAYAVALCSTEELGSLGESASAAREAPKLPPQSVSGNGFGGPRVRERLCQLIRQHNLDAELVKSYAVTFCGTKTLKEATRAQVENFVGHLAALAEKNRDELKRYLARKEGAA